MLSEKADGKMAKFNFEALKNQKLEEIALEVLGLETLETRNASELDFKEQAVWQIKEALEQAYRAGQNRSLRREEKQ